MTTANNEIAYAKINLALHVRRRRDDGYHELDTLFAFVNEGDQLGVMASDTLKLTISGPFGEGLSTSDNLVLDAARALQCHANVETGAEIHLDKRLPVASGIGGGSADAAATLRLLNRHWQLGLELDILARIAEPLGADIPACIYSQTMRGRGTGTQLVRIEDSAISGLPVLLVNPEVGISTAQIFAAWDGMDNGAILDADPLQAAHEGTNGLQKAALQQCPQIDEILTMLQISKPILARMSGSGATCFAIFQKEAAANAALLRMQTEKPDWWYLQGNLR